MSTPLIGDYVLHRSKSAPLRLRLDMNALCLFEAESGHSALLWIGQYEAGQISQATDLRAMCWAMLQRHHPDMCLDAAGDVLDYHPDLVRRVISSSVGKAEAKPDTGKKLPLLSIWRRFIGAGSR